MYAQQKVLVDGGSAGDENPFTKETRRLLGFLFSLRFRALLLYKTWGGHEQPVIAGNARGSIRPEESLAGVAG